MSFKIIGTIVSEFGPLEVHAGRYVRGGAIAIELVTTDVPPEPFATLSVNLPGVPIGRDEFFVKTWSENESLIAPLINCGLFVDTGVRESRDFVSAPVWRFKDPTQVPSTV